MHTYRIVIGDWSDDGHGHSDEFIVKVSHDLKAIQTAYRAAVKESGVALDRGSEADFNLCCEYDDQEIPKGAVERLASFGIKIPHEAIDAAGSVHPDPSDMAWLFMEMVKSQIDGFSYEFIEPPESINGFWGDLNVMIGYGCYS